MAKDSRSALRRRRHERVRRRVHGTAERPRLNVFRSLSHIYAQVIDDVKGVTLAAASTLEKDLRARTGADVDAADAIGKLVAERAIAAGVSAVVFDRGPYLYHGRVKALADGAREGGLSF